MMFSRFRIPLLFLAALLVGAIPFVAVALSHANADLHQAEFYGALTFFGAMSAASYLKWKPFTGVIFGTIAVGLLAGHYLVSPWAIAGSVILSFFLQAALHDFLQQKHSLERAFPLLAHFRRFCELIRPEMQQYFIEQDTEGKPATRDDRAFCYAASKKEPTDISFGTKRDYHKPGQIHIRNNTFPIPDREPINLAPIVLGPKRRTPAIIYGRFGIGDMSFGSLGRNAVESLASGAGRAGILISTGEGGLTPYHLNGVTVKVTWPQRVAWACAYAMSFVSRRYRREPMPVSGNIGCGQIMVEVGTAKFGFNGPNKEFDYEKYAKIMANDRCVATKIKLAQGAKPGGGGHLPGAKVTKEIATIRGIPQGKDCISPNTFDEFTDVPTMMEFIAKLQDISGKPVGIKIVIGREEFINEVAEWMRDHPDQGPDFIHLDGGEGGTGAAPLMLADFAGMPIIHALPLVDNVLRKNGVRDRVVLMSSGKVFNPAQLFIQLALGSDFVFGARGFMFSLGCIQAMRCASGECPAGVTTHHPWLQRALVPKVKYIRVANYAEAMHRYLIQLLRVAGVHDTFELNRSNLSIVSATMHEIDGATLYPYPSKESGTRIPPTPATYGIKAPTAPPRCKPSPGVVQIDDLEPTTMQYRTHPPAAQPELIQLSVKPQ